MSADDLESLHETLFWLSEPGIHESVRRAREEYVAGETVSLDGFLSEIGNQLPRQ